MSDSNILRIQKNILHHLVTEGKLSAAQAQAHPLSENIESIIPDIIRLASDENSVSKAVSVTLKRKLFVEVEEGRQVTLPPGNEGWFIYDNTIWMTNALDRRESEKAMAHARRHGYTQLSVGVVATPKLEGLRAARVDDDESLDGDNEEQKQRALKRIEDYIREAAQLDATDIHLQPSKGDRVAVRYRIDGVLKTHRTYPFSLHSSIYRVVIENLCQLTLETTVPQDGKFDFQVSNSKKIDLRVNSIPIVRGSEKTPKLVMRLLGNNTELADLNKLGMSTNNKGRLRELAGQPSGMIVTTGPTGSGKTTTQYAILLDIYKTDPNKNIHTIEDPVEIQHEAISNTEVTKLVSFADALRAMLRQDPDVILVGEMRDGVTAELAYQGAMTGHLLLTTLHTNNAHESIDRLIRMGVPRDIIATNTTAFIAQRLTRALCPDCKKEYLFKTDRARFDLYSSHPLFDGAGELKLYRANPQGCKTCGPESGGLKGRRGVLEILELTPEIQEAILDGVSPSLLRRSSIATGTFNDLWDDGLRLVKEGVVAFEQLEKELRPYMTDRIGGKKFQTLPGSASLPVVPPTPGLRPVTPLL